MYIQHELNNFIWCYTVQKSWVALVIVAASLSAPLCVFLSIKCVWDHCHAEELGHYQSAACQMVLNSSSNSDHTYLHL